MDDINQKLVALAEKTSAHETRLAVLETNIKQSEQNIKRIEVTFKESFNSLITKIEANNNGMQSTVIKFLCWAVTFALGIIGFLTVKMGLFG